MSEKLYYTWKQHDADVKYIVENYDFDGVVALYRGSLPIATHLSNVKDVPLSIINYQSYVDGEQKITKKKPEWMHLAHDPSIQKKLLVIDDIYDSGNTIRLLQDFIGVDDSLTYLTVFGKENKDSVEYIRENEGQWIVFPWESVN
jgi:hypoxanthine phosphoribosyltransferase